MLETEIGAQGAGSSDGGEQRWGGVSGWVGRLLMDAPRNVIR